MTRKTSSIPEAPSTEAPLHEELICPRGLSEELAATYSGVSVSALRKARMDGGRICHLPPPPYVRLGRKVIYLIDDLDHWLESNRVGSGEFGVSTALAPHSSFLVFSCNQLRRKFNEAKCEKAQ